MRKSEGGSLAQKIYISFCQFVFSGFWKLCISIAPILIILTHLSSSRMKYSLQIYSVRITWFGHVAYRGQMRTAFKILVRKHEVCRPFQRNAQRKADSKMSSKEIRCNGVGRFIFCRTVQFWAVVKVAMNYQILYRICVIS